MQMDARVTHNHLNMGLAMSDDKDSRVGEPRVLDVLRRRPGWVPAVARLHELYAQAPRRGRLEFRSRRRTVLLGLL
jgi:hypothetical protein